MPWRQFTAEVSTAEGTRHIWVCAQSQRAAAITAHIAAQLPMGARR